MNNFDDLDYNLKKGILPVISNNSFKQLFFLQMKWLQWPSIFVFIDTMLIFESYKVVVVVIIITVTKQM